MLFVIIQMMLAHHVLLRPSIAGRIVAIYYKQLVGIGYDKRHSLSFVDRILQMRDEYLSAFWFVNHLIFHHRYLHFPPLGSMARDLRRTELPIFSDCVAYIGCRL